MAEQTLAQRIKAKHPGAYDDMPDAELEAAMDKKFPGVYADVPRTRAALPEAPVGPGTPIADLPPDPTASMGGAQRLLAGAGKTSMGILRGAQQALLSPYEGKAVEAYRGKLSKDEAEARKLGKPLSADPLGRTGEIGMGIAAGIPMMMAPGANTYLGSTAIGALQGAIQPTAEPGERLTNVGIGAGAGLGGQAAGRLASALTSGGKSLIEPLTKGGQSRIAGRTIRQFAGGPVQPQASATPGWQPTLAEATQKPGLAVLERGASAASPETAGLLAERTFGQNAAALAALEKIAGTPAQRTAAEATREATGPLYTAAKSQTIDPKLAASLQPQIESLMRRPAMKQAAARAGQIFGEADIAKSPAGSVQGLQYLKQSLDDIIEKAGSPGSAIGKNELSALTQTRSDLISTMQQLAPDLRAADAAYAAASKPLNEMAAGQALTEKLRPALMDYAPGAPSRLNANQYALAMRNLEEVLPKMTGFPGSTVANTFRPESQQAMTGVAQDLAKRAAIADMARGPGSNTAQNLATRNVLRQTMGPLGIPEGFAESTLAQTLAKPLNLIYGGVAEPAAQRRLAEALLDPALGAQLSAFRPASRLPPIMSRVPLISTPLALEYAR